MFDCEMDGRASFSVNGGATLVVENKPVVQEIFEADRREEGGIESERLCYKARLRVG